MGSTPQDITNQSPMISLTSFELLNAYCTKVKRSREFDEAISINTSYGNHVLMTTTSIMKLAKDQLLQCKSRKAKVISNAASRFGTQSGISSKDLELAMLLQAAAEEVANQKYVRASKLLSSCDQCYFKSGNPVERVVYYFSQALGMKIDREQGSFLPYKLEYDGARKPIDVEQSQYHTQPAIMGCQQDEPFSLVSHFVLCQTILDSMASARKVHLIDFGIHNGSHWTPIMQSFAARENDQYPLELLKITAVGTCKAMLEETGRWLSSFAETIDLPFSFEIIVSDLKDIKEDLFQLKVDESVAVYSGLRLWTLLKWPNDLQVVIRVIRNLKPCVLVVQEIEASTNSPIFLKRFNEALLLFSAMFDCMNACLNHKILYRKLTEEVIFRDRILNIITAEGAERIYRYEKIAFWRSLFTRFGIVEAELSSSSLSEASWLLGRSSRFTFCTVDMDGKCLIMGWNGNPFFSLSAWKFLPER